MIVLNHIISNEPLLIATSVVLGLCIGSFLNVVIYRLPIMLQRDFEKQCCEFLNIDNVSIDDDFSSNYNVFNLIKPSSHCPHCNHRLKPWENVPVISYFILNKECSRCKNKIPARYPCVELGNGLATGLVTYYFGPTWLTLALLALTWTLITLTLIDFDHQLLPDEITIPILWLGMFINTLDLGSGISINDSVIGAIMGYASLWFLNYIYKLIRKKNGMGYGDFKLFAALGAWFGWQSLLPLIFVASTTGAVLGILMILFLQKDKFTPIPFGPFLSGAGFIFLFWGPQINAFYITLLVR